MLASRFERSIATLARLHARELWPPVVPTVVLVESLQGHPGRDALANRLLRACVVVEEVPEELARRAAQLRRLAERGSAVDAVVVALAEPDGTVLTGDRRDLEALAAHSRGVAIEVV